MHKRALQATIVLMWVFLISFAIIKLFFADWFIAVVENERIIQIGNFIDSNRFVRIASDTLIGVLVMHFYLCACKQVWKLCWCHYGLMFGYSVGIVILELILPSITPIIDIAAVILFPLLLKCKLKQSITICVLHYVGQAAILFIRSEPLYLVTTNYAVLLILMFDVYVWLILYYLYANLYKEETLWDYLLSRFSGISRKLKSLRNSKK